MTALRWLLRAIQPLQSLAMSTPEPQLQQLAATREAVLATVGAYLVHCWRELNLVRQRGIPADLERQECRIRRSARRFAVLETLNLPPTPPPSAVFGE